MICVGCQKAVGGPGAVFGPEGPPPGVLPPDAWVQPYQGPPLTLPVPAPEGTPPAKPETAPGGAKAIPPAVPGEPQPMPKKPPIPELPKIPIPEPPKSGGAVAAPILPIGYEPANGIVVPDVPRK